MQSVGGRTPLGTTTSRSVGGTGHRPSRQAPRSHAVFRSGWYWVICLSFGLIAGGEAAFASLLPVYLIEVRSLSQEAASLLLTLHLCGLVAGRFASAYLGDRLSNNAIIALCLAAGLFVFPALLVDAWPVRNGALFLLGLLFSSTWPTFYAQATGHLREHRALLAYGSSLGNVVGISLCLLLSSLLADRSLLLSLLFGPAVLWLFGACYFTTRLAHGAEAA